MKIRIYFRFALFVAALANGGAWATDYYVAQTGSDDNAGTSSDAPFATIDKAVITATSGEDVIHVAAGTYQTGLPDYVAQTDNAKWGPNLKAKLIGEGTTRADVVLESHGEYRTLRMVAGSWVENVTIVGEGTWQADKGGAIEMSGGTLTNCVVRGGTAKANGNTAGGNLYVNNAAALVTDCEIYGGSAHKRGGNVYLDNGLVCNCTIYNGVCDDNIGGNIYQYGGTVSNCVIYGGTALNDGGNVRMNGAGTMVDCVISNGVVQSSDKKGANVYMDSTAKMSRCRLVGGSNTAAYNGGSLALGSSGAVAEDCLVEGSECGGVLMTGTSYFYNSTVVSNQKYGCWAWNNNQHFFNVVIYGNESEWNGNLPNNTSAEFSGCASSDSARIVTDGNFGVTVITDSDFTNYANGDYRPAVGSALIDAGTADPRGASASTTDLDGNLRTSGMVDIGCYEYQKQDMVVHIDDASYSREFAPATVTFTHSTDNSTAPESVEYIYDFGDGSAAETTFASTISHEYAAPGVYTVTITATNETEEATMTYAGYVRVASSVVYVTSGNSAAGTFPYDTPERGYGNLKTAVQSALDGYTLLVGAGVYETTDQISINNNITVRGIGAKPDDVIVRNTVATPDTYYHRTMEVNKGGARIENIAIENGCVKNQHGGNLKIRAGVVSNCVIRGGLAVADGGKAAGGGVALTGTGVLTHCVITNNAVNGTSDNESYAGGAVYVEYSVKDSNLSNLLVANNTYEPSEGDPKTGAAGIRLCGGNDNTTIENCTVAANVVRGSLKDDSAGIYCTTWYGRLRNNIVVGNYETGKSKYTAVKMDVDHGTYVNNITDADATPDSLFRNFAGGDFALKTTAAAYDAGTTNGLALRASVDLAGNPRVFGKSIDAGCYECQKKTGLFVFFR